MSYIDLTTITFLEVYIQTEILTRMVTSPLCAMPRVMRTLAGMPFLFSTYPAMLLTEPSTQISGLSSFFGTILYLRN